MICLLVQGMWGTIEGSAAQLWGWLRGEPRAAHGTFCRQNIQSGWIQGPSGTGLAAHLTRPLVGAVQRQFRVLAVGRDLLPDVDALRRMQHMLRRMQDIN